MNAFDERDPEQGAAAWIARLQSRSVSTHDLADFARWRRDPRNASAYERAEQFWDATEPLGADPEIEAAVRNSARVRHLAKPVRPKWRSPFMLVGGLLACALIAIILVPLAVSREPATYATVVGERSILRLQDGTQVQLDTNSHISAAYRPESRRVSLVKGRAFFDVRHD